jgi:hypothetical protein
MLFATNSTEAHLVERMSGYDETLLDLARNLVSGRLAAEYTLVDNVFTTPLEPRTLCEREGARMHRPDGRPSDWAAVNQKNWSPSGSILD